MRSFNVRTHQQRHVFQPGEIRTDPHRGVHRTAVCRPVKMAKVRRFNCRFFAEYKPYLRLLCLCRANPAVFSNSASATLAALYLNEPAGRVHLSHAGLAAPHRYAVVFFSYDRHRRSHGAPAQTREMQPPVAAANANQSIFHDIQHLNFPARGKASGLYRSIRRVPAVPAVRQGNCCSEIGTCRLLWR
jgi:hypothetical protein